MSSICFMMSDIVIGQSYVLEDLGNTDLLFELIIYRDTALTNTLICSAPSVCCTSKLNLKLICHANGDKAHRLGFAFCNLGDKRNGTTPERALRKLLNTEVTAHTRGNFPPFSQRCVDKSRGRSFYDRPVSPGDARLTPNRGYTASPSLFHFNSRDGLRERRREWEEEERE